MHRQVHVRKPRTGAQRSKAAAVVIAESDAAEAPSAPAAPPGMKEVTRSKRQPADRAPATAPTEAKSDASAPSVERNISRRPDRTVKRVSVSRTRPPSPTAVNIHPAAVVIRSPAPVIIRNPGPSPIGFIHPAAIPIRSPASGLIWPPHLTVIRNFRPGAAPVEIFGSDVVVVRVPSRFRIADHVVAIGVPLIKVVAGRSLANLVLLVRAGALNGNELILSHPRAALRSRNFDFPSADQHFRVIVGSYQNSKTRFAPLGANRHVGRIDLRIRIAVLVDGVVRHAVPKLNLDLRMRELRDVGLRMLSQPQHVCVVKLEFSARLVAGRNAVARQHRRIERSRRPILGVATLRGDVAMNQADARHSIFFLRSWRVVARFASARVVGAGLRRALIHRTLTHRILVSGTLVRGTLIVGAGHRCRLNVRRRFRILIRHLVVRVLSDDSARNRDHQS